MKLGFYFTLKTQQKFNNISKLILMNQPDVLSLCIYVNYTKKVKKFVFGAVVAVYGSSYVLNK